MPGNPQSSDLHVDRLLTDLSIAHMNEQDEFFAHEMAPVIASQHQSDKYAEFTKGDWFRDSAERRVYGSESAGIDYNVTSQTYNTEIWSVHANITEEMRENADDVFDLDDTATELVTQSLLIREEIRFQAAFFATSIWTTDFTPGNLWNTATGKPITDMLAQRLVIKKLTGKFPNKAMFGPEVIAQIQLNAQVTGQLSPTSGDIATLPILAGLFNLDSVHELATVKNTAVEGATDVMAFIHGKNGLLVYAEPNPGKMKPSAAYTFAWTGFTGSGPNGQRIKRFNIPQFGVDRIEGEIATDLKLVSADLGVFINAPIS